MEWFMSRFVIEISIYNQKTNARAWHPLCPSGGSLGNFETYERAMGVMKFLYGDASSLARVVNVG